MGITTSLPQISHFNFDINLFISFSTPFCAMRDSPGMATSIKNTSFDDFLTRALLLLLLLLLFLLQFATFIGELMAQMLHKLFISNIHKTEIT